ncbi:MAG: cobalamin-dependent protein, partial [Thermoguttaceae bacterium]|nr:cobalamin-dependent protein [Thermoguttaceae bacterium]
CPQLKETPESKAFARWKNLFVQTLEELAVAVEFDRPPFFVEHARWLRVVLEARGVPLAVIRSALECLTRVIEAELPGESAQVAATVCRGPFEELERQLAQPARMDVTSDPVYGRLAGEYLLALLEGDRPRATRLVLDAAAAGHPVAELYAKVLLPAQEEAGRLWEADQINVAEEHFGTAATRGIMAELRSRAASRPGNGKTFVGAAVAGNHHELGLQAVADFFELDGWRVIQLGCDVPIRDLAEAVGFYQADLLGLSASQRTQLVTLKQTIEAVRQTERGAIVKILVGGRALQGAEDLATQFGADGYAADPSQAIALGNALVGLATRQPLVQGGPAGSPTAQRLQDEVHQARREDLHDP